MRTPRYARPDLPDAKTAYWRIGSVATLLNKSVKFLRYHVKKQHIPYTPVKEKSRTFICFTPDQIKEVRMFIKKHRLTT